MTKTMLTIACTGDQSLHRQWFNPAGDNCFDLMLLDFSSKEEEYRSDADYYLRVNDLKWRNVASGLTYFAKEVEQYDYVWIPDDDLEISHDAIATLLTITQRFNFAISQPAIIGGAEGRRLSENGSTLIQWTDYTHSCVLWEGPEALFHYTNFIEIQAPLFRRDALCKTAYLFSINASGYGVDNVFSTRFPLGQLAVIDAAPMVHTRPLRKGGYYDILRERHAVHSPLLEAVKLIWKEKLHFRCLCNISILTLNKGQENEHGSWKIKLKLYMLFYLKYVVQLPYSLGIKLLALIKELRT